MRVYSVVIVPHGYEDACHQARAMARIQCILAASADSDLSIGGSAFLRRFAASELRLGVAVQRSSDEWVLSLHAAAQEAAFNCGALASHWEGGRQKSWKALRRRLVPVWAAQLAAHAELLEKEAEGGGGMNAVMSVTAVARALLSFSAEAAPASGF